MRGDQTDPLNSSLEIIQKAGNPGFGFPMQIGSQTQHFAKPQGGDWTRPGGLRPRRRPALKQFEPFKAIPKKHSQCTEAENLAQIKQITSGKA